MITQLEKLVADHPEAKDLYSFVRGECPELFTPDGTLVYATTLSDSSR